MKAMTGLSDMWQGNSPCSSSGLEIFDPGLYICSLINSGEGTTSVYGPS